MENDKCKAAETEAILLKKMVVVIISHPSKQPQQNNYSVSVDEAVCFAPAILRGMIYWTDDFTVISAGTLEQNRLLMWM